MYTLFRIVWRCHAEGFHPFYKHPVVIRLTDYVVWSLWAVHLSPARTEIPSIFSMNGVQILPSHVILYFIREMWCNQVSFPLIMCFKSFPVSFPNEQKERNEIPIHCNLCDVDLRLEVTTLSMSHFRADGFVGHQRRKTKLHSHITNLPLSSWI